MPDPRQLPEDIGKRVALAKFFSQTEQQLSTPLRAPAGVAATLAATSAGPQGLPVIDWAAEGLAELAPRGVAPPADWRDHFPLPEADIVVMTWTADEWAALHHVFASDLARLPNDKEDRSWRDVWLPYRRDFWQVYQALYLRRLIAASRDAPPGAPSLDRDVMGWGSFCQVDVGPRRVLLFKSALHINQDGEGLPLLQLVRQILADCKPSLLLSVGTAGGVRQEDGLGDTLVTRRARFHFGQEFASAAFNDATFTSEWQPSATMVEQAESLLMPVPEAAVTAPSAGYGEARIEPRPHVPRIKIVDLPILTTDFFEYGTTMNRLDEIGCCVEMDDAVIAKVASEHGTRFGFLRNVSDPVITGDSDDFPKDLQTAWAVLTYATRGLYTSFNSAVATWAMIAGEGSA